MKTRILLAALAAAAIVGCGGDEGEATKTVTVTKTVTATPSPSAVTPTPTPAPPGTGGAIAAEGAYAMKLHQVDYHGVNVTVEHGIPGNESQWQFRTACNGDDCSIQMRRELGSGGFKAVTLHAAAGRPNVFEGTSTGTTRSCTEQTRPTRQRYSIRLSEPQEVDGRAVAAKVGVYFTEDVKDCGGAPARGVVSWRGTRAG